MRSSASVSQEISQPLITEVILPRFLFGFRNKSGCSTCVRRLPRTCEVPEKTYWLPASPSGKVSKAIPFPVCEQPNLTTEFFYRDNFHYFSKNASRIEATSFNESLGTSWVDSG